MRLPAVFAAVPLLAGTAAAILLVDVTPQHLLLASAAGAVFALISGCGFLALQFAESVLTTVALGCFLAGFSSATAVLRQLEAPPILRWFHAHDGDGSEPVSLVGRVRDDAAATDYGASLVLDVTTVCAMNCVPAPERVSGGVRLSIGGSVPRRAVGEWRAGRTLHVAALLRTPATYSNPGVPDESRALARRGIALTGSAKSPALVDVLSAGTPLTESAGRLRAWARHVFAVYLAPLSERSAAIAAAILIGDRTGLSDDDERRLQDAGIYHVIAISGGNIAIFTAILLFGARLVCLPPRAAAIVAIAVLLFYGEVAGGAASVSRAISAAVIFLLALALDHRGRPLNTVGVAAILGVTLQPAVVVDPGFLLSFTATAAIILGVPRLLRSWHRARVIAGIAAATVCAEVALAPIAATFFTRITAAGLIVNFVAIPLMTLVQAGAMGLLAVSTVSDLWARRLAVAVHWCAEGLIGSSRLVDVAPWLARDVPAPSWWLCTIYYAAGLALLLSRARRVSFAALAVCAGIIATGSSIASRGLVPAAAADVLRVVVLNVGQGDATVAIFPNGGALLIDAGGLAGTTFDMAGRVIVPALRALQIRTLDALVVTHADPDHVSGAEGVLRAVGAGTIWEGVPVPPNPALRALAARARAQRSTWRTVRPGDIDRFGDVEVRVLHPPDPEWERQRVRNDDSVVLEIRYRDVSVLLPGDVGRDVEQGLVGSLRLARTVILKAPHHGSATSSTDAFLDATSPRAVIFSTGRNNRFGHPAPVVVDRYAARGIERFNTATDGAVFVETDGRSVKVWGWGSRRTYFSGSQ